MPVVTRSASKRSKKLASQVDSQAGVVEPTPRRSARLAAKRSQSREPESTPGSRQTSATPGSTQGGNGISNAFEYLRNSGQHAASLMTNPGQQPRFSGITLGSETLKNPMQFLVPRHEAESPFSIRQVIRKFSASPVTLKQAKIDKSDGNESSSKKNRNKSSKSKNKMKSVSDDESGIETESEIESDGETDTKKKSKFSFLLDANRLRFGSSSDSGSKMRVPTFDEKTQSWSFEPETEVPKLARNLAIFIVAVIVVVLAVVYKDELTNAYNENVTFSFSKTLGTVAESTKNGVTDAYNYVSNTVSNTVANIDLSSLFSQAASAESAESAESAAAASGAEADASQVTNEAGSAAAEAAAATEA